MASRRFQKMEEVIAIWNQATSETKKYINKFPKIRLDWEDTNVSWLGKMSKRFVNNFNSNLIAILLFIIAIIEFIKICKINITILGD